MYLRLWLILARYQGLFLSRNQNIILERCGPKTKLCKLLLWVSECLCREAAQTGTALVRGVKAASETRTANRCAPFCLLVKHTGCIRGDAHSVKVHGSAVRAARTGQKGLSLSGSCTGWRVILEDGDKYYTLSSSMRASALCLIYALPKLSSSLWLLWGGDRITGKWHSGLKEGSLWLCWFKTGFQCLIRLKVQVFLIILRDHKQLLFKF